MKRVCVLGAAAAPVGRWQRPFDADEQVLGREVLSGVVLDALSDAGVDRAALNLPGIIL